MTARPIGGEALAYAFDSWLLVFSPRRTKKIRAAVGGGENWLTYQAKVTTGFIGRPTLTSTDVAINAGETSASSQHFLFN